MIKAPFDGRQVANLNRYQEFGAFHPFNCGHDHDGPRRLVATPDGWVCPHIDCDYTQEWAHSFMAEFSYEEEKKARGFYKNLFKK